MSKRNTFLFGEAISKRKRSNNGLNYKRKPQQWLCKQYNEIDFFFFKKKNMYPRICILMSNV